MADAASHANQYKLAISFEPQKGKMSGTAHIIVPPQEELTLSLQELNVTGILLNRDGNEALSVHLPDKEQLFVSPSKKKQEIFISYTRTVKHSYSNRIREDGIVLTSNWYPQPDRDMYYSLQATVPKGFTAISESDSLNFDSSRTPSSFALSQPLSGIHFVAAPYQVKRMKVREGVTIYTLFFNDSLAEDYLKATAQHIRRYEALIGPFPYNHYAVVENHLPTGFGIPTFTLLGQAVIRLPFIKDTSLGHEVLHSWFGNSVGVDNTGGNWCEGLTSYLADWAYHEEKGEATENRKENILSYLSYNHSTAPISLGEFSSASHYQPMARAVRAVGYTRGAFLFHELKGLIGGDLFLEGLRHLYRNHSGENVSWKDIQQIFEHSSSKDLSSFFNERLSRKDIPILSVANTTTRSSDNTTILSFDLYQNTETPFSLKVPILVKTGTEVIEFSSEISALQTEIALSLQEPPLAITIDPDYSIFRMPQSSEITPTWSQFMGAEKKRVILSSEKERKIFEPLIARFANENWEITTADTITNADLQTASLLFLGTDNSASRSLFGPPQHPSTGFSLNVKTNPLHGDHVAVLVSSSSLEETTAVVHRLSHYGKYSYLHFKKGKIATKTLHPADFGQKYIIEQSPVGASVTAFTTFEETVEKLKHNRVIYIGETHTSLSDHILQFRLIQALFKRSPHLAIGMEMFPTSSQEALNNYVLGKEDLAEDTFLKNSRYFEVWRYDWRFFRDIFNFAKRNSIPILGLNIDRNIVSHVFKNGSTDGLSEVDIQQLPRDRDLSMPGYRQRLSQIYGLHMQGGHANGNIGGFIQAQGLWDEAMANNIVTYLKENPTRQMIVLAGAQHTRKDSGIPPRVTRYLDIPQASVLNVNSNSTLGNVKELADYFFLASKQHLPPAAKIGIILNQIEKDGTGFMQVIQLSPHGHAEKAGLQEGDILLSINGNTIHNMEDVQIAMIDARAKDIAPLTLLRKNAQGEEKIQLLVELYTPSKNKPHP